MMLLKTKVISRGMLNHAQDFKLPFLVFQTFLSKHISRLRTKSANISDERIHLTGQIISGSLPVKMLGWEDALIEKVEQLRKKEQTFLTRMSLIRGGNQALVLIIQPLAAFVAFTVAWAQGRRLEITGAFYALVLLGILKFSMAFFFMAGTWYTEAIPMDRASCSLCEAFLS